MDPRTEQVFSFEVEIPKQDVLSPEDIDGVPEEIRDGVHKETFPVLGQFTPSYFGKICNVRY